jgi:hypothetical protein
MQLLSRHTIVNQSAVQWRSHFLFLKQLRMHGLLIEVAAVFGFPDIAPA